MIKIKKCPTCGKLFHTDRDRKYCGRPCIYEAQQMESLIKIEKNLDKLTSKPLFFGKTKFNK